MPEAASLSGRIENGEHVFPTRVYYDDTDATGVVYYANFLRMTLRIACVNRAGAAARLPNRLQSALQKFLTEQGATNMRQS